jgi:hypothetical protein
VARIEAGLGKAARAGSGGGAERRLATVDVSCYMMLQSIRSSSPGDEGVALVEKALDSSDRNAMFYECHSKPITHTLTAQESEMDTMRWRIAGKEASFCTLRLSPRWRRHLSCKSLLPVHLSQVGLPPYYRQL